MTRPNPKHSGAKAIVRWSGEAAAKLAPAGAALVGIAIEQPVLGPVVAIAAALPYLGGRLLGLVQSTRVRRAISRLVVDNEAREFYEEQLRKGGHEHLRREVLDLLRELDEAISDLAVEPLTRLLEQRARGRAEWPLVRAISSALRRLNDEEVAELRRMLDAALENSAGSPLVLSSSLSVADSEPLLHVSTPQGDSFEVPELGELEDVFRQLVSSGVAATYVPQHAQASADGFEHGEAIVMDRERAEFTLSLFAV